MSIINSQPRIGAAGQSTGQYKIERSLRFNSADSAYLNRTPASAGNRKTFTWSFWMKRTAIDGSGTYPAIYSAGVSGGARMVVDMNFTASGDLSIGFNNTGSSWAFLSTAAVFRDFSAWYHIVIACDLSQATSSNRVKIYVNNVQQTLTGTYPPDSDSPVNNTVAQNIGRYVPDTNEYLNAYLTEFNFIDGSAKTPSDFGETDTDTGVWKPKAYSGSYGTNGFYLKFADNSGTTSTTLGKDSSGNGNNWTPNNFSVTAGAGNDSLVDTPTPYGTDTGAGGEVRGNYATINPTNLYGTALTLSNGNLDFSQSTAAYGGSVCSISIREKTYFEVRVGSVTASTNAYFGVGSKGSANDYYATDFFGRDSFAWSVGFSGTTAYISNNNSFTSQSGTVAIGDVMMVAVDPANGKIWFGRNGTWYAGTPSAGTGASYTNLPSEVFPVVQAYNSGTHSINFGQRPFAYTAPSGFKALCTQNLPTPTIGATSATQAGKYFNTVLYTGNGSTQTVSGLDFQPDFVWIKGRGVAYNHRLVDAVRGGSNWLYSNVTDAENAAGSANDGVIAFNSSGFNFTTSGVGTNSNGNTFVAWCWDGNGAGSTNNAGSIQSTVSANTTAGFSIVTYTGNGTSGATVGHGCLVNGAATAPNMIIIKNRTDSSESFWAVYHKSAFVSGSDPNILYLNSTAAQADDTNVFSTSAAFTSTTFKLGDYNGSNGNGDSIVAYCFAPVAGYSAFGSYTGNGSSDGPFVYTGFRPKFVMIKCTTTSYGWVMLDSARNTYNPENLYLYANLSDAEATFVIADFLSNGFKIKAGATTATNDNGQTFAYVAFAENPFKYSLAR